MGQAVRNARETPPRLYNRRHIFQYHRVFRLYHGIIGLCAPSAYKYGPSFGIALMAVGVLMRDGLAVIIGAIIGSLWVAMLAGAVVFLGTEGIDVVKDFIKSLL